MNALDQLLEKGREEGRKEGSRDVARRMLAMGLNVPPVAEATLLDEADVRALLAETPDRPIRP